MALWDKLNKMTEKVVGSVSGQSDEESSKSIHDEFTPQISSVTGKKTTFRENDLLHGTESYPYSQLSPIQLVNKPTSQLMQGVAQTATDDGRILTIVFTYKQTDRFLKAMNYANEKIAQAHGQTVNYKFVLQSLEGSKLEVYDDYALMYYLKTGFKSIIENSMRAGATMVVMYFADMDIQYAPAATAGRYQVVVLHGEETYTLELGAEDQSLIEEAIAYITEAKQSGKPVFCEPEALKDALTPATGVAKTFTLCGEELQIPQEMDVFNSYRLTFHKLAADCTECVKAEFEKRINNLNTYIQIFPNLYRHYLDLMLGKAMEIMVAEGVWSATTESFSKEHTENFHLVALDIFTTMQSIEATMQANQQATANMVKEVSRFADNIGLNKNRSGNATIERISNMPGNIARKAAIQSAASINLAQQIELYNRIDHDILFEHVFLDYWGVYLTLIAHLREAGKDIWWAADDGTERANNIFANLKSSAFLGSNIAAVYLEMLKTQPYNKDYYAFMVSQFGDNAETTAIKDYFGYSDLSDKYTL
jgi:hypothetical protein